MDVKTHYRKTQQLLCAFVNTLRLQRSVTDIKTNVRSTNRLPGEAGPVWITDLKKSPSLFLLTDTFADNYMTGYKKRYENVNA